MSDATALLASYQAAVDAARLRMDTATSGNAANLARGDYYEAKKNLRDTQRSLGIAAPSLHSHFPNPFAVENQAPYRVAFVATPPAAFTDEQFREQVLAKAKQANPYYLACTSISHRPTHMLPDGTQVGEVAYYNVQVWDMAQATLAKPSGKFCFVAQGETAAICLTVFTDNLAQLTESVFEQEMQALAAEPTRFGNQQVDSYLALAEAA